MLTCDPTPTRSLKDAFIGPGAIVDYDVYSMIWEAESGEISTVSQQWGIIHDRFAVAVKKGLQLNTYH